MSAPANAKPIVIDRTVITLIGIELLLLMLAVLIGMALSSQSVIELMALDAVRTGAALMLIAIGGAAGRKFFRGSARTLPPIRLALLVLGLAAVMMASLQAACGGWLDDRALLWASLVCAAFAMLLVHSLGKREPRLSRTAVPATKDR